MKTIRKDKLYWICQVGGWGLFTLLELVNYATLDGFRWGLMLNVVINFILGIFFTHLYRLFLIRTAWLELPLYKLIPRALLAVLVITMVMTAINIPLDRYTYPIFQQIHLSIGIFIGYCVTLGKYVLLWALTYHMFQYWEKSLLAEKERYKMAATLKENAYNNLKTQLNPHFLFNSLNSIRTLVDLHPDMAKQAITQLSGLLRSSLHMGKNKTVALKDELQTVKDYLAIETIRFDERLQTLYAIDEKAMECQVPPMMLQTLVENAVKHGISNIKKGGLIELSAHKNAAYLHIDITNSGQYNPLPGHNGVGLENTRERLSLLYDGGAVFEIANKDQSHVITHIQLPL
jgi:sensor histidine kinase YesM